MKLAKTLIEAQERVIGVLMQANAHKSAVRKGAANQFKRDLDAQGWPEFDRSAKSEAFGSIQWSEARHRAWQDCVDTAKLRLAATEDED